MVEEKKVPTTKKTINPEGATDKKVAPEKENISKDKKAESKKDVKNTLVNVRFIKRWLSPDSKIIDSGDVKEIDSKVAERLEKANIVEIIQNKSEEK